MARRCGSFHCRVEGWALENKKMVFWDREKLGSMGPDGLGPILFGAHVGPVWGPFYLFGAGLGPILIRAIWALLEWACMNDLDQPCGVGLRANGTNGS